MRGIALRELQINNALQTLEEFRVFTQTYPQVASIVRTLDSTTYKLVFPRETDRTIGQLIGRYVLLETHAELARDALRTYNVDPEGV